jgi:flavorubredoxin
MKPLEIADGIYSVGVRDWNVRDFHGYSTPYGTTYNAFLVVDEKIALIDTVKAEFTERMLENIGRVLDPKSIDMVISNHTEMDHSGAIPHLMHRIGEDKIVYCSKMGRKNLALHFGDRFRLESVENGATLALGRRKLTFLETRMLHWPDSMFTYMEPEKILFSSDGFGQHYAGYEVFDDEIGDAVMPHAKKYFANILLLYAAKVLKVLKSVKETGLDIGMICPDHGILWRQDPGRILDAYARWSRQEPLAKAVVLYDTMWHSTATMAESIAAGIHDTGVAVRPMNLRRWHRSDVMTEVLDAAAVVVGSPTLNNGLFPTVADMLSYMKGLKPRNKVGATFGSYGWSGEAVRLIQRELEPLNWDWIEPGLRIQYRPDAKGRESCHEFGHRVGQAVLARLEAETSGT